MKTPYTELGLRKYDDLDPVEAVKKAWIEPGNSPIWHETAQDSIAVTMPLLARALERLTKENKND